MAKRFSVVVVLVLILAGLLPSYAWSGRNADGALIVHTAAGMTYTAGRDYCGLDFDNPGTCIGANTQVDVSPGATAVIWVLAAFPAGSSPGVTVAQFGVEHSLSSVNIVAHDACGNSTVTIPDAGFPDSNTGIALGFYPTLYGTLFPCYWFAIAGNSGDTFGTAAAPTLGQAVFVDESGNPEMDEVTRFGYARWGSPGNNQCPPSVERREASLGQIKSGYRR